jgi:FKBP-type peptidyl-prolyl cis-trans isomerase 2
MKKKYVVLFTTLLGIIMALSSLSCSKSTVSEGKTVKVHYTLTVDGQVVDSSNGSAPLQFKAGEHKVIPGFEKAVMGMKVGEKKSFQVSPEEAYGPENPKAFQDIPKKQLPPNITPKKGMTLSTQSKDGQRINVRVHEVKKDVVVMNFNHPLAGKTLHFDIEVVEIQ